LGLECRANDQEILDLILPLMHVETNACVRAERAFNAYLEGGCQVPIAGFATLDGQTLLRSQVTGSAEDAEQLGVQLAQELLKQGAGELLKALYQD